jgi:hypothetical protein
MTTVPKCEFDAAKVVAEEIRSFDDSARQRILRWAAESLGMAAQVATPNVTFQAQVPSVRPVAVATPGQALDIKTFVGSKQPKSDVQFATVVAYYHRFESSERRESIGSDVLQEAARHTGRPRLSNPTMTLNNAKSAGYLNSTGRGQFSISTVGENLVAMTLPGGPAGDSQTPKKAKKKSKSARAKK